MYVYIYIYMYIYTERERERHDYTCLPECVYVPGGAAAAVGGRQGMRRHAETGESSSVMF